MRGVIAVCSVAVLTLAGAACQKSESEKTAEQLTNASSDVSKGAQDMAGSATQLAQGFAQLAKGMQGAAGGGSGDVKPVDPVSFHNLEAAFPDLDGWEKGKPVGEKMTSPFPYSEATTTYKKGDSRIEAKIMDSGFNQLLLAGYSMFLRGGYEKETDHGYEKSLQISGNPGGEKWDGSDKSGELSLLVAKRYLVTLDGNNIGDTKPLHELAEKIDLGKLPGGK